MLEDFRLKVFMAVVQERSFTKAAAVLGITQPAVSQNVADLEKMLGRKIFDRQKGAVVLTPEGEVFLIYVEKLLETCVSVDDMFSKVSPAVVKIAASEEIYAYLVGPALEAFAKVHPDVRFERCLFGDADLTIALVPSSATTDDVISRIRMSVFVPQQSDSQSSSQEKTSYFDVVYRPSQAFGITRLSRLIRHFLAK
jgi:DNA-binding transcriptional LysR family regulator